MMTTATATAREPREASGREGRDSHGRRPHSSSRSRRDDPSPRRRRDERRHEPDRSQHRRRAEEGADDAGSRDERRSRHLQEAKARSGGPDPGHGEGKPPPPSDAKENPPARHERSPRGTKRFSETREAWRPRSSFFQHHECDRAGQGGRRFGRQDYGRQRDQNEHLDDRDKHKSERHGLQEKVGQAQQQSDVDSTWKHDGFFKLEEDAPVAKRRPGFKEMGMPLEGQESAPAVTEPNSRSRIPDQPGLTSGMGEERRNCHSREFIRPDDRGTRWGFSDYRGAGQRNGYDPRGAGQRNGYDPRGRFAGRGGRGRDRFDYQYGGRSNMHEDAGDHQTEKWKHDLYDETNSTPAPMTEEEQIAKVEALLAL